MDGKSLVRILGLGLAVFLFVQFVLPKFTGSSGPKLQPLGKEWATAPAEREAEATCEVKGGRFRAVVSSRDAALQHYYLDGDKYTVDGRSGSAPLDMVTTPDLETRRPLRFSWRDQGAEDQLKYDLFDWKLGQGAAGECVFTYRDDDVSLTKTVRATGRPFEIEADVTLTNLRAAPAKHRAAVETVAWRTEKEVESSLGRQSPFTTQVECEHDHDLLEKHPSDFAPDDFAKPGFQRGWFVQGGAVDFAAVGSFFFAQALVPLAGPGPATCELQVEDRWNNRQYAAKKDDPMGGAMYRARLGWPVKELGPSEAVRYQVLAFNGPKEREVLAEAGSGAHRLSELIHLGRLASIAKVLVSFLIFVHAKIGSWGLSIIVLTLGVRTVLFPLMWKQIQSGLQMRRFKPEIDEINKKYADDMQQKQLAMQQLWKKNGINPLGGCLPAVVQMPVWFALYTALQTAAELYHTPFLWFHDLSAPDTIRVGHWDVPFILPLLLGATTFVQQKLMPQQMDAAQQKMMMYMMPAIFTAMMLFLPSGLGVYMLTNSLLGIVQQVVVERYYNSGGKGGGIGVRDAAAAGGGKGAVVPLALGKGKAGV